MTHFQKDKLDSNRNNQRIIKNNTEILRKFQHILPFSVEYGQKLVPGPLLASERKTCFCIFCKMSVWSYEIETEI